jgi:excisionase family DNA binding protein
MVRRQPEDLLKLDEIVAELRVDPSTVRRWLRTGQLKGYKLAGNRTGWRVRRIDLERFVESRSNTNMMFLEGD